MNRLGIALLLSTALACVPAHYAALSPLGAPVALRVGNDQTIRGELLAVSAESIWVKSPAAATTPRVVALATVSRVRVDRDGTGSPGLRFGLIFGAISGVVMEGACSSVDGNSCGGSVLIFSLVMSLLLGWAVDAGSDMRNALVIVSPTPEALQPYARFPQGLPAGFR